MTHLKTFCTAVLIACLFLPVGGCAPSEDEAPVNSDPTMGATYEDSMTGGAEDGSGSSDAPLLDGSGAADPAAPPAGDAGAEIPAPAETE